MVTSKFSEAQRNAIDALIDGRRLEVVPVDDDRPQRGHRDGQAPPDLTAPHLP